MGWDEIGGGKKKSSLSMIDRVNLNIKMTHNLV